MPFQGGAFARDGGDNTSYYANVTRSWESAGLVYPGRLHAPYFLLCTADECLMAASTNWGSRLAVRPRRAMIGSPQRRAEVRRPAGSYGACRGQLPQRQRAIDRVRRRTARSGGRAAVRNRGQRVGCDFAAEDKRSRPLNNALLLHFFTTMISVVGHACVARLWTG